jgi:hypothetical protein
MSETVSSQCDRGRHVIADDQRSWIFSSGERRRVTRERRRPTVATPSAYFAAKQ